MATIVRSIDPAAAGYVRHRFVRALSASFVVAAVFGLLALVAASSVYAVAQGGWQTAIAAPLGIAMVFVVFGLPVVLAVALAGAVIDVLHRRLVGLTLFAGGLFITLFLIAGIILAGGVLLGFDMTTKEHPQPMPVTEALWFGAFSVVGALISYELTRAGWWQMWASAQNFRAVRGWRPPPWRLLTSFRRQLGLPGFLSYVGKKRRVATLLYFGVAVLNLGLVMLLLLPPIMGGAPSDNPNDYVYKLTTFAFMSGLLLLNLLGAGAFLARMADARTTKLYQGVREWDGRPPIVFLRAFDQDDNKLQARGGDAFARWPAGVGRPRTLDEILLEHGSPYGPVIAIGDPRDPAPPLGAARVFAPGAGADWQEVVRGLAGASKAVVMCPNTGEGVRWELDLIAQAGGRLRTIFLASPALDRDANMSLFTRLVPGVGEIKPKQSPLAAYEEGGQWRVLTARRASVESYTAALNTALQGLFGTKGETPAARR
jgi:hypothetical protein